MAKKEGGFTGWLQRVRRTGEFSDLLVQIGGVDFRLHMLPFLNASSYFRDLSRTCSRINTASTSSPENSEQPDCPEVEACVQVVDLSDLPGGVEGFSAAADFCYLLKPTYTLQNVAQIRAVAEYLGMVELQESTKKFLYVNVFSHWRFSAAFLQQYERLSSPVDEYVESRCLKVIVVACTKAFGETKYLSAPMPLASSVAATGATWQSSPSQALTEVIVRLVAMPDLYVAEVLDSLVEMQVNLNLKCRQGRNVRSWLDSVLTDECVSDAARCWLVLCLARLLLKGAPTTRPWLELSSQYWCSLLEHVDRLLTSADEPMQERLLPVKKLMQHRIGASLFEIDEYLHSYRFGPSTLLALVLHFIEEGDHGDEALEEVAEEVDGFIWNYAEGTSLSIEVFVALIKAFPAEARHSHDTLYGAIEKLLTKNTSYTADEKQNLWRLIDRSKLSPSEYEKALNNPGFLCQPHILESVLQQHSEELAKVPDGDGRNLRHIMQKVINASLKLLEENSRRSKEILELQKQYAALLGGKICPSRDSCYNSPDLFRKNLNGGDAHSISYPEEETEILSSSEGSETHNISIM